ncbi:MULTISPECIES: SDR family oxidoreductase [Streptomyces]|uniref:SDR family oxidoreductase n=2 Tax=Streptomyces rimosus subsp. rimosus TaxID=132474 RepID=L8ENH3_STRR1|nr:MULTISPECIES: SDR family oxidoreductase [Streptomyces]KOG76121.1 short-chain dehydrogenase [Kitasatospora aureofaciens]MYT44451.1 SDR family NAD(P)-dependent oxidoreductase [Streptomyces sp. SID5471]KEF07687.1 short-chain dehydrogenase [Streptomyces rimosus]KOT42413.1 short-chain dehydrogenase [Streptomyces sp. NRRL WC-3701]KOT44558.1 short-chain dehydrogenase [Streptomyces rimosus subsp. rimosus]
MAATTTTPGPLTGKVALVAGATRGAGRAMAVELGRGGATVYVTGRTTRGHISEVGRSSETIEETAELVTAAGAPAGGTGVAVPTDHLDPAAVRALTGRIDREQGRLDLLVNDLWGGDVHVEWGKKMWEHDLEKGLRVLRLGVESHIITSSCALPLLIRRPGGLVVEVTDGTEEFNRRYREPFYYDLAKSAPIRMAKGLAEELPEYGCTAVCVTPGWLRSEAMLDTHFKVTEENWRAGCAQNPHFAISETPVFVGRAVAALAADPEVARFNGQALSSGGLAKEYGFTDVDGSAPDAWRYITEVEQAGKPADTTGYR